ncbi:MAG TPA: hypothetical protein VH092_26080, partial [Urbifossiella sp.]|nr:hypothetical protein [Urbifossiella sp.]
GKAGALCEPARLGRQKCPLIVRPTSEDNVTAHLVHALRLLNPRHWVSDLLNTALGGERFRRQVYRRFRVEPWVGKSPFSRHLIPWAEGGSEIDVQLSWENPPTTVFVEAKYGSALSGRTNRNDGSHGFPSDQLVRNIRVGLYECGYYQTGTLFTSEPREFAVILLAPDTGMPLVREYRDPDRLSKAIPYGDRITWPRTPFVGEIGYKDIRNVLILRRRFSTRAERHVIDQFVEYLMFKHQTRPNRTGLPMAAGTGDPASCGDPPF